MLLIPSVPLNCSSNGPFLGTARAEFFSHRFHHQPDAPHPKISRPQPQHTDNPITRKLDPVETTKILERLFAVLRCSDLSDIKCGPLSLLHSLLDLK